MTGCFIEKTVPQKMTELLLLTFLKLLFIRSKQQHIPWMSQEGATVSGLCWEVIFISYLHIMSPPLSPHPVFYSFCWIENKNMTRRYIHTLVLNVWIICQLLLLFHFQSWWKELRLFFTCTSFKPPESLVNVTRRSVRVSVWLVLLSRAHVAYDDPVFCCTRMFIINACCPQSQGLCCSDNFTWHLQYCKLETL